MAWYLCIVSGPQVILPHSIEHWAGVWYILVYLPCLNPETVACVAVWTAGGSAGPEKRIRKDVTMYERGDHVRKGVK